MTATCRRRGLTGSSTPARRATPAAHAPAALTTCPAAISPAAVETAATRPSLPFLNPLTSAPRSNLTPSRAADSV